MLDLVYLEEIFGEQNISLSADQMDLFDRYAERLCEYNKKVNLTAITEPREIAMKHFLDSVLPFTFFPVKPGASVIDVGTGAGFPGAVLAIYRPDLAVTLLDSLAKRLAFLRELLPAMDIPATTIHARAEDAGQDHSLRERFDIATARAVAPLHELAEYCLPFVKPGGYFAALKGSEITEELAGAKNAIATLGGQTEEIIPYTLPDGSARHLILIKKISQTPTKYPRNPAKIAKNPLV